MRATARYKQTTHVKQKQKKYHKICVKLFFEKNEINLNALNSYKYVNKPNCRETARDAYVRHASCLH